MLLSIIIAAYNVEAFIEKCILSCYDKDLFENIEILVVDDGSTDHTLKKVICLKENVKNLNVIEQKNQGLGASRNIGLQAAKGKYVWMIDGDDYIEPGSLTVILENIEEDLDLYCVNYNVSDEKGKVLYKAYPDHYITSILSGSEYYSINYEKNYTWQYIFRRDLFLNNNIVFKERINMQDSEILPKILNHVQSVKYVDIVGYNYVQYQNSFTNTQDAMKRYKYFQSIIEVRDSLLQYGESIKTQNPELYLGVQKKLQSLKHVVFNHLVFYKYKNEDFKKNISLLKEAGFYPVKTKVEGKMNLIKIGINYFPLLTNYILNFVK
mgnify:CR=1 FL=1